MAHGTVVYFRGNPAFETPGPKIEDGWVWLIVPATSVSSGFQAASSGRDFLSEANGSAVTEADVAVNGAQEGTRVGDSVWYAAMLNVTDPDNLNTLLARNHNLETDIPYPVTYGVVPIQSEIPQQTRVYIGGGPVKVWLNGALVYRDASGSGEVNDYETAVPVTLNAGNNLLFVAAYRPSPGSRWSAFFGFQDGTGYTVGVPAPSGGNLDVNGDGTVNIQDLILVASNLGETGENDADVNGDEIVDIRDLVDVAAALDTPAAAPALDPRILSMFTTKGVQKWLSEAQHLDLTDPTAQKGIRFLEQLLTTLVPKETSLLPNYPNPFNPETWIPYQLAKSADVTLTIYAVNGQVVRQMPLGHQSAGTYQSKSRAVYWNGKNAIGESVASGLYFYTLTAGDFTATREMLIRK